MSPLAKIAAAVFAAAAMTGATRAFAEDSTAPDACGTVTTMGQLSDCADSLLGKNTRLQVDFGIDLASLGDDSQANVDVRSDIMLANGSRACEGMMSRSRAYYGTALAQAPTDPAASIPDAVKKSFADLTSSIADCTANYALALKRHGAAFATSTAHYAAFSDEVEALSVRLDPTADIGAPAVAACRDMATVGDFLGCTQALADTQLEADHRLPVLGKSDPVLTKAIQDAHDSATCQASRAAGATVLDTPLGSSDADPLPDTMKTAMGQWMGALSQCYTALATALDAQGPTYKNGADAFHQIAAAQETLSRLLPKP